MASSAYGSSTTHDVRWIRLRAASGIAHVAIMVAAAVIGAELRPGYSHIQDSVSELIEVGVPNKALLDWMVGTYHLLFLPFAFGLHLALPRTQHGWFGPLLLGVAGLLGIVLTVFFPCDVGCAANPTTITGKGHGVIVVINVLFVFAGMTALAQRMRQHLAWNRHGRYTLASAFATLGLGLATIPLLNTDYTGLGERLALILLYLWFVATGFRLWRSSGH